MGWIWMVREIPLVTISPETNHVEKCTLMLMIITSIQSQTIGTATFIYADDLSINLWILEISNQSFNIVDVKPVNMEELTGELHFFWSYSSLKGSIHLIDLRQSALCDSHSKIVSLENSRPTQ
ncbi:hypothetical protein YC2023_067023 [Brassica napus]